MDIGHQPAYPCGSRFRFRRCSCRKFCAAVGALWTTWPGVPGVELVTLGLRPLWLPPTISLPMVAGQRSTHYDRCVVPLPLSHLLREVHGIRVSRVRQFSLTMTASVTFASWVYGSPSRLARVPPPSLISCPRSGAILGALGGSGHVCLIKRDELRAHCDTA
jgi:hypothetical protein